MFASAKSLSSEQFSQLLELNSNLLEQKRQSYQEKIIKYKQKISGLEKYLQQLKDKQLQKNRNNNSDEDDESDEEVMQTMKIIQSKITEMRKKKQQYEERLLKLDQIEKQMQQYQMENSYGCDERQVNMFKTQQQQSVSKKKVKKSNTTQYNCNITENNQNRFNFTTPNSKSFSKVTKQPSCLTEQVTCTIRQFQKRVPLGQLLSSSQINQTIGYHEQSIAQFKKDKKIKNKQKMNVFSIANDKDYKIETMSHNNNQGKKEQRARTKSVPSIYPFGKSQEKGQRSDDKVKIDDQCSKVNLNRNSKDYPGFTTHPKLSLAPQYLTQLQHTISQLYRKYPFLIDSDSQVPQQIPFEESLFILLKFIESQECHFQKISQQTLKNQKVLQSVRSQKNKLKSLDFDKLQLQKELEQLEERVNQLINREKKVLEDVDRAQKKRDFVYSEMKKGIDKVSKEFAVNKDEFSLKDQFSLVRITNFDVQSQLNNNNCFKELITSINQMKQSFLSYLTVNNKFFTEISLNKNKLQTSLQKLKAQLQNSKIKKQDMQHSINQSIHNQNQLLAKNSQLESMISSSNLAITSLSAEKQSLQEQIKEFSSILQTKKESITKIDQTIERKKLKKKQLFEMVQKMEKVLEQAQIQRNTMHEKITQDRQQVKQLQNQKLQLQKRTQVLREKYVEFKQTNKNLEQNIKVNKQLCEQLKTDIDSKRSQLSQLQKVIKDKQYILNDLKLKEQLMVKSIQQLTVGEKQQKTNLEKTRSELQSAKKTLLELQEGIKAIQSQIQSIEQLKQQKIQENSTFTTQLKQKLLKLTQMNTLEQSISQQITQKQLQLQQLSTKIEQTTSTKQQLQSLIIQILNQKQLYIQQLQNKHEQFLQLEGQVQRIQDKKQKLQRQVNNYLSQEEYLQKNIQHLSQAIKNIQEQLKQYQEEEREIVQRLKVMKKLEFRKCIILGLSEANDNLNSRVTEQEQQMITNRIQEVIQYMQQSRRSKKQSNHQNNHNPITHSNNPSFA